MLYHMNAIPKQIRATGDGPNCGGRRKFHTGEIYAALATVEKPLKFPKSEADFLTRTHSIQVESATSTEAGVFVTRNINPV